MTFFQKGILIMAKRKLSVSFSKAVIDMENMTITEINKDDMQTFSLKEILSQFSGIEGVSLSVSADESLSGDEDG